MSGKLTFSWARREPPEERARDGTPADRGHKLPLGQKVRNWVTMLAMVIIAIAVNDALQAVHANQGQTRSIARQQAEMAAQQTAITRAQTEIAAAQTSITTQQAQYAKLVIRLQDDERQSCQIQAGGLPVSHELAAIIHDIHALVAVPTRVREPPRVRLLVADLNGRTARYQGLESHQPRHLAC